MYDGFFFYFMIESLPWISTPFEVDLIYFLIKADLIDSNAKFKTIYEQNKKLNYNLVHPEMIYNINKIKSPISRLIKFPQYTIGKLLSYIFKK